MSRLGTGDLDQGGLHKELALVLVSVVWGFVGAGSQWRSEGITLRFRRAVAPDFGLNILEGRVEWGGAVSVGVS